MDSTKTQPTPPDAEISENDPRDGNPQAVEAHDPHSGVSDDPRVDPTPDRRHTS